MSEVPGYSPERAQRFYSKVRRDINQWIAGHTGPDSRVGDYLLFLPDLFVLLMRLILDRRVPAHLKVELVMAITYIISPIDLLPEALLGPPGLVDDVFMAALALSRLLKIMGEAGEEVLREHWEGDIDVLERIQQTLDLAETFVSAGVLKRLRQLLGSGINNQK